MDFFLKKLGLHIILPIYIQIYNITFTVTDGNESWCKPFGKFYIYFSIKRLKIFLRMYPNKDEMQKNISTQDVHCIMHSIKK